MPSDATLPQVVSITKPRSDGSLVLKKEVRKYLGIGAGEALGLRIAEEILLVGAPDTLAESKSLDVSPRGRVWLPSEAWDALCARGLQESPADSDVALVQRPGAVALKCVSLEVTESLFARYTDVETSDTLTRRVEMNPRPEDVVPALADRVAGLRLHAGILGYLRGRQAFHAWCARQTLGRPDADDRQLRDQLIEERLDGQRDDGSWGSGDNRTLQTARALRELADLGVDGDHPDVQGAASWLMKRAASDYNPGQWFGDDDLVAEQADVVATRIAMTRGTRPRFRKLKAGEQRRVLGGDDLIIKPCGPRIMWPNALVLEALLRLGYEDSPRVQQALSFMLTQDWCECGYQNGTSGVPDRQLFDGERLAAFEETCWQEYRLAGLQDPAAILAKDLTQPTVRFLRAKRLASSGHGEDGDATDVYELEIDRHVQGCEFITTRSLSTVKDSAMRRFARAHLWRFAGQQLADGTFPTERYGTGFGQLGILETFSRYPDHPVTPVVILKALPWLVDQQQPDGSWVGQKGRLRAAPPNPDTATRAAVNVLNAVSAHLPPGFWGRL